MKQIRLLALAEPEHVTEIEELLESEYINRMATLRPQKVNLERAVSLPVDAVVLLTTAFKEDESRFIEQLFMLRNDVAIILISGKVDTELYSRAISCGINRVIPSNTPKDDIQKAVENEISRLRSRKNSSMVQDYDSRVISVFGAKGGCGKTTTAVNLAAALQKSGKKVALLDLHLEFGNVGIFLNLPHCDTISDLISESKITASTASSYLFRHGSGLYVLCAPPSPEFAELIKPDHIERIITVLRPDFDYLVIDLASSLNDCTLAAFDMSDSIYFVTNPEISALKDTKVCLEVLKTLDYMRKIRLVLNRSGDSYISEHDVEQALEFKPYLIIPSDVKASVSAINRGIPVINASPRSKMSKAIIRYVDHGAV